MNLRQITIKDFSWRMFMTFMILCPIYFNNLKTYGLSTMRIGHEQFFQLGVTFLFILVFLENLWLAVFLIWSILIYIYYNFPSIGGNYIMNLFMAAILYQVTYKLVNRERVKQLFMGIIFLCFLNLGFTILQVMNFDVLFRDGFSGKWTSDPVGIMGIKAVSGMFSAICIPIAMFFSPWLTLAALPALVLSQCSSAVAATVVSILFLAWQRSRQVFFYMLVPILILGALYVSHDAKANMMTNRANLWRISVQDALSRPFVGMGLDSFRNVGTTKPYLYFQNNMNNDAFRMKYIGGEKPWVKPSGYETQLRPDGTQDVTPWDNPHNEFVSILYEFGVTGFLIFCALLWDITRRLYRDPLVITIFAVFLVYLVCSIGQFPFHLARTAHFAVILLACYYKLTEKGENHG